MVPETKTVKVHPGWYLVITDPGKFTVVKLGKDNTTDYKGEPIDRDSICYMSPLGNEMFYAISICHGDVEEAGRLILAEKGLKPQTA